MDVLTREALDFFRAGGSLPSFSEWLALDEEAKAALIAAREQWEREKIETLLDVLDQRVRDVARDVAVKEAVAP